MGKDENIEQAVQALRHATRLLADQALAGNRRNHDAWYLIVEDGSEVVLDDLAEKRAYAAHGLAATMWVLNQPRETTRAAAAAPIQDGAGAQAVQAALRFDLGVVAGPRPTRAGAADRGVLGASSGALTDCAGFCCHRMSQP